MVAAPTVNTVVFPPERPTYEFEHFGTKNMWFLAPFRWNYSVSREKPVGLHRLSVFESKLSRYEALQDGISKTELWLGPIGPVKKNIFSFDDFMIWTWMVGLGFDKDSSKSCNHWMNHDFGWFTICMDKIRY